MYWIIVFLTAWISTQGVCADADKRMVIIGDSLTEGYGVTHDEAYPALLQNKIKADGKPWQVVNSGLSGSTTASAVARVKWQLKQKPDLILLALGANDGLRGLSVESVEKNLSEALKACLEAKVKVVLVGIKLPPNYGADYIKRFEAVFPRLAKKFNVPLIPFLLENVGGDKTLNQADGIHPNAKGHALIANQVYQKIRGLL